MKPLATLLLALLAFPAAGSAQVAQTVAGRLPAASITPKAAGDVLLVECDYGGSFAGTAAVTDAAGTAFTLIGKPNTAAGLTQFVALSAPLAAASADTVSCPSSTFAGEIYIVEFKGAATLDGYIQTNGAAKPAAAGVASTAGDTIIAFCVTGTCSAAAGWTTLSAFDSNLVASLQATGPVTSASFGVNSSWVLTLVTMKPAPAAPPPAPAVPMAAAAFVCTPGFLPVTFSTFVPTGAKGLTFSIQNSDPSNSLVISQVTAPRGFAIDALTYPLTIAPGDSQTFTIRFVPPAAGSYSGNVVFLANVAGGDFLMGVSATAN